MGLDVKRQWLVSDRFPTSFARNKADEAIDDLPEDATMTVYVDTWLRVYKESGGIESGRRRR